jgi:hypothetical protein
MLDPRTPDGRSEGHDKCPGHADFCHLEGIAGPVQRRNAAAGR